MSGPRRSVVLVGLSGAGKTTAGRRAAAALGAPFVDLDAQIERRAGAPIGRIFAEQGEAVFRQLEGECGREALAGPPAIIAVGGGYLESEANRAHAHGAALVVYLRVGPAVAAARLGAAGDRPLLAGAEPAVRLADLLARREAAYLSAHQVVETDGAGLEAVAEAIASLARTHGGW